MPPASSRRRIRTEKKRVSERNPGYSLQLLYDLPDLPYSNNCSILPAIGRARQRVRLLRGDELVDRERKVSELFWADVADGGDHPEL